MLVTAVHSPLDPGCYFLDATEPGWPSKLYHFTTCKERNAIQTNKKEQKTVVIYEKIKMAPNFQKRHFRTSKRNKKKKTGWQTTCVF